MKNLTKVVLAVTFISYFSIIPVVKANTESLRLVNVVFRHGDRAPDSNGLESYPKDPYASNNYLPMGLGGLLNKGKMREYALGQYLRKHYGDFLGDTYIPKEVGTRSTDVDRTKMSLQLVLAGLYPPNEQQKWNDNLDWQPIPTHTIDLLDDTLMVPEFCPRYLEARQKVEASPEFQAKTANFTHLMKKLSTESGKAIRNSNDMYFLYHGLMAEKSMGLELPGWADAVMKNGKLLKGINLEYEIFSYNTEMRRLNGGMMLRKFYENMLERVDKTSKNEHKIYLYSGHETNVAAMLQALGVYQPHAPEYSSAVILELHEDPSLYYNGSSSRYYVKVKYYKGKVGEGEQIVDNKIIPGCTENCPLYKFRSVLKDIFPSDEEIKCDKRVLGKVCKDILATDDKFQCNKRVLDKVIYQYKVAGNIITQINTELNRYDKTRNILH